MSNLILSRGPCPRKTTEAEVAAPTIGMAGWVTVELIDVRSGVIKQYLEFPNVITNAGLGEFFGTNFAVTNIPVHAAVGTNNTAPAVTDTALGAQVGARTTATGGIVDTFGQVLTSPEYFWWRRTREWGAAEGNGNLTEFGLFSAATGGVMWCRALFRDAGGTPITVVKTAADILRVTYEFRLYPALGDSTQTALAISGTNYDLVWRPVEPALWAVNQWNNAAQGIFSAPTVNALATTRATLATRLESGPSYATTLTASSISGAWNSGTLVVSRTAIWEPAAGAITIASFVLGALRDADRRCPYHGTVTPAMGKTASNRLTLNYTQQWARVTP